jgi:OPA family glycerol-3-phosphate transporter-like MFS transporter
MDDNVQCLSMDKTLRNWRISTFWVLLLGYIGYYLVRANMSAAFPLLSKVFGYTNSQLGLIAFYSELSYSAGKFLTGPVADKIGGKKIFLTGMAGGIVMNVVFSQLHTLSLFIIAWSVCRFFLAMGWPGIVKIVSSWYPPEQNGTVMGLISINFQFGGVVATLFAGLLIARGSDWQGLFLYPAAVVSIVWIWSLFCSKESPQSVYPELARAEKAKETAPTDERSMLEIIKPLLKNPYFREVLIFSFITTFLRSIFFFWTPKFLVDAGMGTSSAVIKSGIFPLLGCLSTIFLGWYTDRHSRNGNRAPILWKMLIGLGISLSAIAFAVGLARIDGNLIVVLLGAAGFFLLGPYSMSAGGALATWLTGVLSDQLGWEKVFFLLALVSLVAALSALRMSLIFERRLLKTVSSANL